jgi:hypothetical protein
MFFLSSKVEDNLKVSNKFQKKEGVERVRESWQGEEV